MPVYIQMGNESIIHSKNKQTSSHQTPLKSTTSCNNMRINKKCAIAMRKFESFEGSIFP